MQIRMVLRLQSCLAQGFDLARSCVLCFDAHCLWMCSMKYQEWAKENAVGDRSFEEYKRASGTKDCPKSVFLSSWLFVPLLTEVTISGAKQQCRRPWTAITCAPSSLPAFARLSVAPCCFRCRTCRCGEHFCNVCGVSLSPKSPYGASFRSGVAGGLICSAFLSDHFNKAGATCILFDKHELED
jgi:hypothetical protein